MAPADEVSADRDSVLLKIYQGLAVRDSGVLVTDLEDSASIIQTLESEGLAITKQQQGLNLVLLSDRGRQLASEILQTRASEGFQDLAAFVGSKPPKIVTFLIQNHIGRVTDYLGGSLRQELRA